MHKFPTRQANVNTKRHNINIGLFSHCFESFKYVNPLLHLCKLIKKNSRYSSKFNRIMKALITIKTLEIFYLFFIYFSCRCINACAWERVIFKTIFLKGYVIFLLKNLNVKKPFKTERIYNENSLKNPNFGENKLL